MKKVKSHCLSALLVLLGTCGNAFAAGAEFTFVKAYTPGTYDLKLAGD